MYLNDANKLNKHGRGGSRKLNMQNLNPRCKNTVNFKYLNLPIDFVFTFKSILNFRVRTLSGPKTAALTPFSFRLDTWSFFKEINGKNNKTNCLNNFSFTTSQNVQLKRPVELSPDSVGDRDE